MPTDIMTANRPDLTEEHYTLRPGGFFIHPLGATKTIDFSAIVSEEDLHRRFIIQEQPEKGTSSVVYVTSDFIYSTGLNCVEEETTSGSLRLSSQKFHHGVMRGIISGYMGKEVLLVSNWDMPAIEIVAPFSEKTFDLPSSFVREVSKIQAVKTVIQVRTESGMCIWTILDMEPENQELRYDIYDIEGRVLDHFPDVQVDFRLINLAEYPDPDSVHIPSREVIYQREQTRHARNQ